MRTQKGLIRRKGQIERAKQNLVLRNRATVLKHLLASACIDCGESDHVVLDFDHRDRSKKRSDISGAIRIFGEDGLRKEMLKCDIRCSNCHRAKTYLEGDFRSRDMDLTDVAIF